MANLVISGDTSGSVTLSAPAASGTTVLNLPTSSGTLVVSGGAQTVEFAAGSAAAPSITFTGDTNTGIFFPAADTIAFSEGGTEAMRIDGSGNVGIGVTAPTAQLATLGNLNIGNNSSTNPFSYLRFGCSQYGASDIRPLDYGSHTNGLAFYTDGTADTTINPTERMRIDSSGNFMVGTTTAVSKVTVEGGLAAHGHSARSGTSGSYSGNFFNINWTGNAGLWIDTTFIGNIAFQSDYRIKRNIETQTAPAIERVMALRPVTYQMADYGNLFKASDDIKEGFIAHEVQEVIPSGAEGAKDEENRIQNLRLDAILAVAVKAIQEQQAMITELKATVDAQAALITQLQTDVAGLKGAK